MENEHFEIFLVHRWIVSWDLIPQGTAIHADHVCEKLEEMVVGSERMGRKRDEILLLCDNCRPHFVKKTQEKLKQWQGELLPHPAYGLDISPSDYHLFRSLEEAEGKTAEDRR